MKKVKLKKKELFIIILCVVAALLVIGDAALSVTIYKETFNRRYESYEPFMLYLDDFDGLERTKYEFSSDKGQKLTGYMYSAAENQHGILVMAHGFGGGGHNSYMDCANYFAQNGYYVFCYDATGNDESEGEAVGGLPQGVIDLDYAISFVEESGNFPELPIVLFGHSWGGYSVSSVLTYHPEVKAVIECSGFNRSSDLLEAEGKNQAGNFIYLMMPFLKMYERIKFGEYAVNTALDGFASTDAAVMVVHSSDDKMVPVQYGYDIYYDKYKDDSRFEFIRFEDAGHNYVYDNRTYEIEFFENLQKWVDSLDYDSKAEENQERFRKEKADYIKNNLDRDKWCNMLDTDLFKNFLDFYNNHLQ